MLSEVLNATHSKKENEKKRKKKLQNSCVTIFDRNNLFEEYNPEFTAHYSTETAFVKITSFILMAHMTTEFSFYYLVHTFPLFDVITTCNYKGLNMLVQPH